MHSTDARILRGAAIPTTLAGLVAIIASLLLAGGRGAFGSAVGAALVLVFFTLGMLVVSYVTKMSQQLVMAAALFGYLVKLGAVFILVTALSHVTIWSAHAFGWTVLSLTIVWLAAEVNATVSARTPYVDSAGGSGDLGKRGTR
jgi:ATP synthase protein I